MARIHSEHGWWYTKKVPSDEKRGNECGNYSEQRKRARGQITSNPLFLFGCGGSMPPLPNLGKTLMRRLDTTISYTRLRVPLFAGLTGSWRHRMAGLGKVHRPTVRVPRHIAHCSGAAAAGSHPTDRHETPCPPPQPTLPFIHLELMRRLDREINLETEDWSKPKLPVWSTKTDSFSSPETMQRKF